MSDDEHDTNWPAPDDIARLRGQAEQRFVIRCAGCSREIAKSAADDAGWQRCLSADPWGAHRCPECAEKEKSKVATCPGCASQIAISATKDFGWRYWPDETGEHLYCAACAIEMLDQRRK